MSVSDEPPPDSPAVLASNNPTPRADAGTSSPSRLQLIVIAVLVLGYAGLSHYSESSRDARSLGAILSVGPILLIAVVLIWRWVHPLAAVVTAAFSCALLHHYWAAIERNYEWSDLIQQCGAYGLVAMGFMRTLVGGRVPLCTQLAIKTHGELTPVETAYTRRATAAWAVFYGSLTVAILVLFLATPLRIWSFFVNFAIFGLILLGGFIDHAVRRRVLPRHPSGGILTLIQRSLIG